MIADNIFKIGSGHRTNKPGTFDNYLIRVLLIIIVYTKPLSGVQNDKP